MFIEPSILLQSSQDKKGNVEAASYLALYYKYKKGYQKRYPFF